MMAAIRVTRKDIVELLIQGFSISEIARMWGVNKGSLHRILKKGAQNPEYSELLGSKPRRSERKFNPLWKEDPQWVSVLYDWLPRYLGKYASQNSLAYQEMLDYLLDMAYTSPQILEKDHPIKYFKGMVRKRLSGLFTDIPRP